MTTMYVHGKSGVNADYEEVTIFRDGQKIHDQRYYYGYDISWHKFFAKKEKPMFEDLLAGLKEQYGVDEIRRPE